MLSVLACITSIFDLQGRPRVYKGEAGASVQPYINNGSSKEIIHWKDELLCNHHYNTFYG